jgi:fibronectin-binding autotransporter adhesin
VTAQNNGVYSFNSIKNVNGGASSLGNPTSVATGTITLSNQGGTLRYIGTGDTTDRVLNLIASPTTGQLEQAGTGLLKFTSAITSTNGNKNFILKGSTAGTGELAGAITDGAGGVLSITKQGTGTWLLSGTNTYTGTTTVTAGILQPTKVAALAGYNVPGKVVFNGGTLGIAVDGVNWTSADVDTMLANATKTSGTLGIDTTAGPFTEWAPFTAANMGSIGLAKYGPNTLTLSQANTYIGPTTILSGTLSASTLANGGVASNIGAAAAGAAGLVLNGGTFSYTGASTTTDRGFTSIGAGTNVITVGAGVSLNLGASAKNDTGVLGAALTLTGGVGSAITLSSLTISPGSSGDFNAGLDTNVTINTLNVTGYNVLANRTSKQLNIGDIVGSSNASGWLSNMNVSGTISGYTSTGGPIFMGATTTLTGLNTFTNQVFLQGPGNITNFNSIKNVGAGASSLGAPTTVLEGTIGIGAGANATTLRYIGTGDTTDRVIDLRSTTATATIEQAGTGLLKFTSNLTATGAGSKTLALTGSTAGTGELAGTIINNSVTNITSLSKSGTGKWTLSGVNTYTGTTAINGGTLALTGATQATTAIIVGASGSLGLDIATPVAAASAAVTLGGTVSVTGTPVSPNNYTLLTASSIGGTPTLATPIPGYSLVIESGNTLKLNFTGAASPYDIWSGGAPFAGDANGDGVENGLAFLLGAANPNANALGLLPAVTQSGGGLIMTFNMLNSSARGTATLNVEHSSDVGISDPWTGAVVPDVSGGPTNGVTFVVTPGSPTNSVTATISSTEAASGKLFGRLKGNNP